MSAVLHLPVINTQSPYMLKDKPTDAFAPAFTAVNGRGSPPSPNDSPGANGVNARSSPHHHSDHQRPAENGYRSGSHSTSPTNSSSLASPDSPNKRKRTDTPENLSASTSAMEAPQQRSLPPIDRPSEHERRWTADPQPHPSYQIASRPMEPPHGSIPPMATAHPSMVDPATFESSSSTNRNGVQVDVKKRKRQFANRTKTGCGTCRRRKKKCDEAKPECNNCSRGGFVCEGYASKVPWPKNGITKPPPPLQAKEQMSHDPSAAYPRCPACNLIHIPHCDPARSNGQAYPDPRVATSAPEGARTRPITVDEPERKPPAPTSWTNGWTEPPPRTYAEQPPPIPAPYSQPPPPSHERPPSHDRHLVPQGPPPPPPRQHNPHVYQTPQPLSQPAGHPPAVSVDNHRSAPPQQPRQPPMALPTSAPPVPPQPHYVSTPRSLKTEKEKMLNGEPFLPYDEHLVDERAACTNAVYGFNNLASPQMHIGRGDRERMFKRIVQAGWINSHGHGGDRRVTGHYGGNVSVTMPFHCDYGYNLSIGDNVCIGAHCQFLDSARIAIGRNTKIGARVTISTIKTPTEPKQLKGTNGTEIAKEVHIGENVYIGEGVIIEAGVKIGHNAIIRSGSVVAGDIAPDVIAMGNPAFGQPR